MRKSQEQKQPAMIGQYTFDEFKEKAKDFHGYPAPGLLLGAYMVEAAKARLPEGTLFEVYVETAKCLPDAVQMLTLCTYGNGRIHLAHTGRYALALFDKHTGEGWRCAIDPDKLAEWPEIQSWLLKLKPKREQDTDQLFHEISMAGDSVCSLAAIQVPQRLLGKQSSGSIAHCPSCGEPYTASDGPICLGCLGDAPYLPSSRRTEGKRSRQNTPKSLPLQEAVGRKALHDMTRVVPGVSKGPAIIAGQEITAGDVCELQRMGRAHVYVEEAFPGNGDSIHENKAALDFARLMAGKNMDFSSRPREGKVDFFPVMDGLFVVDRQRLKAFNHLPDVMCATRQSDIFVEVGRPVAGVRAIPLLLDRTVYDRGITLLKKGALFSVLPLRQMNVGILVTGTEVFQGLVQDRFIPLVQGKVEAFGCKVTATDIVPDDRKAIAAAVSRLTSAGVELLVTTAGLSVDPDDVTRLGLLDAGLSDMLYGAPLLPGAMTLLGRIGETRVMGVPACALFHKTTSFDLLLPRILAGRNISRSELADMADGGFCLACNSCTFPKCPFGK